MKKKAANIAELFKQWLEMFYPDIVIFDYEKKEIIESITHYLKVKIRIKALYGNKRKKLSEFIEAVFENDKNSYGIL